MLLVGRMSGSWDESIGLPPVTTQPVVKCAHLTGGAFHSAALSHIGRRNRRLASSAAKAVDAPK